MYFVLHMNVSYLCDDIVCSSDMAQKLWDATCLYLNYGGGQEEVSVACVDETEMAKLNGQYRNKNVPTNVLTFSYDGTEGVHGISHDVILCLSVARREARDRGMSESDYVALLLVHAFLHACGMDHENSEKEALETIDAERKILFSCGISSMGL